VQNFPEFVAEANFLEPPQRKMRDGKRRAAYALPKLHFRWIPNREQNIPNSSLFTPITVISKLCMYLYTLEQASNHAHSGQPIKLSSLFSYDTFENALSPIFKLDVVP